MKTDVCLVLTTCPDETTARSLAQSLVEAGLAACVNLLAGVNSVYRWEGRLEESAEVLLLAKTTEACLAGLEEAIRARHPYELPEIIAVPVTGGLAPYLHWVRQACTAAVT